MKHAYSYAPATDFIITPYGWGYFSADVELQNYPDQRFNLPVTLDTACNRIISVHLWQRITRGLKLQIATHLTAHPADLEPALFADLRAASVQYSPAGGCFHTNSQSLLRFLLNKQVFCNTFADFDEADQGGFI